MCCISVLPKVMFGVLANTSVDIGEPPIGGEYRSAEKSSSMPLEPKFMSSVESKMVWWS